MDVIYWLIPLSVAVLIVAVLILFWAVKNGQFQDLDSPAVDILFDDDEELSDLKRSNSNDSSLEKSQITEPKTENTKR